MKNKSQGTYYSKKVALYMRVSTDAQYEDGYSIDAQRDMLVSYSSAKGFFEYELYIDGGYSGSNMERPELKRMLCDVQKGNISFVIVYKLDRLSRSQKDTLYMIEDVFNKNGTGFISMNENMDTSTPIGRAMLGIMSAFAQLERETIRERTRMGMTERVKKGLWMGGGKAPFGYSYNREKGILEENDDSEKVRELYRLYLSGYSLARIADELGLSSEQLARQILLRKTNIGAIVYNGHEYKGAHKAIIDENTYTKAIELYNARSGGSGGVPCHLLTGLVRCGICGCAMRYQLWSQRDKRYKLYCYSQDKGKRRITKSDGCKNAKVWADDVESEVIADIFSFCDKIKATADVCEKDDINAKLLKKKENYERKLKRLYLLYSSDGDEILLEAIESIKHGIAETERKINEVENIKANATERKKAYSTLCGIREIWQYMTLEEKRALLRRLIESIVIRYDSVEIHYRTVSDTK